MFRRGLAPRHYLNVAATCTRNSKRIPHIPSFYGLEEMPPQSQKGQKGTGSKKGRDVRQSRSRNTTPALRGTSAPPDHTPYLTLPIESFVTVDDIIKDYGSTIPSSKDLEALLERLNRLVDIVEKRGSACDRGMRLLAQAKKDRHEEIENERREEERKERIKRDAADEEERGRNKANKLKKRKDLSTAREERPLTHGAHSLAPQDGANLGKALGLLLFRRHILPLLLRRI